MADIMFSNTQISIKKAIDPYGKGSKVVSRKGAKTMFPYAKKAKADHNTVVIGKFW